MKRHHTTSICMLLFGESVTMYYPRSPFSKYPELVRLLRQSECDFIQDPTELLSWLCRSPSTTILRVNRLKTTPHQLKHHVEQSIAQMKKQPLFNTTVSIHTQLPDVLTISPWQSSDDALQPEPRLGEVIVDVTCGAALLRGAHLYAPGVMAMLVHTAIDERVNIYADAEGVCKKGTNTIFESDRKVFIGIGVVQMQRYQLFGANLVPSGIAVLVEQVVSGVATIGDEYIPPGHGMLQNLPSIVCGHVLAPKPGETVLDMCAAPGNKTTHIAALMGDTGRLVALDKTPNKLKLLLSKMSTFELRSVECYAFDSTKALDENPSGTFNDRKLGPLVPPFAPNTFDRILLDAPCSALGNRPQLRNDMSPKMLASYPVVQKKLFRAAVGLLKPGGVLVYSTCTIAVTENERMVGWALEKFGQEIELEAALPKFGGSGWAGHGLNEDQRHKVQRFGPSDGQSEGAHIDTVGFFIAKFVKKFKINA